MEQEMGPSHPASDPAESYLISSPFDGRPSMIHMSMAPDLRKISHRLPRTFSFDPQRESSYSPQEHAPRGYIVGARKVSLHIRDFLRHMAELGVDDHSRSIKTKPEFWSHLYTQMQSLLRDERNWVTNCANAASLIYHSLLAFPAHFGSSSDKAVNWCGVYLKASHFPTPGNSEQRNNLSNRLLLGPFCGKPACQFINTTPGKARGVCADAFLRCQSIVVPDVEKYPGHIACDGETKSEIVVPLVLANGETAGVLDLDCLAINGFDDQDKEGLENIGKLIIESSDW